MNHTMLLALTLALITPAALSAPVTLRHTEGTTTLKSGDPRRVVVLDEEMLGWLYALNLGDRVVGLGSGSRLQPGDIGPDGLVRPGVMNRGFLGLGKVDRARYVGAWTAPNLETILALKPDLILRSTWAGNGNYAALNKIAPTVGFASATPGYWQVPFRKVAALFGQEARADAVIAQVGAARRAGALKLSAAGVFKRFPKVIAISPFAGGVTYVSTRVRVIDDLRGLGFRDGYRPTGSGVQGTSEVISDEALLGLDRRTLVVVYPPAGQYDGVRTFLNSAVGQRLRQQTVVYERPDYAPWSGPLVSLNAIQELTRLVLAKEP